MGLCNLAEIMAGIYIHIPFCRQACHYCDFHFSTNLKTQNEMVDAIAEEIKSRKDYLNTPIKTIYFGGGTPSLLSKQQIDQLLQAVRSSFKIESDAEITLEANPEDLSIEKAAEISAIGINRLSIGVQTFNEQKLNWMNRIHSSQEAHIAYANARKVGFENISLDLIYAIPDHDRNDWEQDLKTIVKMSPEHISLYGLTIEEKTVFGKWEKQNKLMQVPEDEAAAQYLFAIDFLKSEGYQQYEVSNFGKTGFSSKHNNAYWSGVSYLGVGPGAHSFDGKTRRFNIRNNPSYIKALSEGNNYSESEELSATQIVNEQILTQLRTTKGLNLLAIEGQINQPITSIHSKFIDELLAGELIEINDGFLSLKPKGFLVADEIALRLFFPE